MHNVWLIAKREYMERVTTRTFRVMTVLIPLLMVGGLVGGSLVSGKEAARSHIEIVAAEPYQEFALDLQSEFKHDRYSKIVAEVISPPAPDTRLMLNDEEANKELDGYLWVMTPANASLPPIMTWTPRTAADIKSRYLIAAAAGKVLTQAGRHSSVAVEIGVDGSEVAKDDKSSTAYYSALFMFFIMYFVIMLYGMNVARSIIEEKTSRVFEVLLATIRPEEMMAGKMIGVGGVGLTQVAIWLVAAMLLNSTNVLAQYTESPTHLSLSALQMFYFVTFFLLGYLLYSSIAAALGAMTNSEQELQQMNMFLVLPLACCFFAIGAVSTNSNGIFATVMSLVPFFTPLIMFMRISLNPTPLWQIALSIVDLVACIWVCLWVASRIYRVGILMYGKKPSLAEVLRWLKYS